MGTSDAVADRRTLAQLDAELAEHAELGPRSLQTAEIYAADPGDLQRPEPLMKRYAAEVDAAEAALAARVAAAAGRCSRHKVNSSQ